MIDFEKSIISSLFDSVDQVGANLVNHTYHNLVQAYAPFMWTMAAIFVGFYFLRAMHGRATFYDGMMMSFRIVAIMTFALNYSYFSEFIYDVFTREPLHIMAAITDSGNVNSVSEGLDNFLNLGVKYADKLFMMGSWSNPDYYLFGGIVFVVTALGGVYAAGLIILSKCAMIILLALSPIFIFCGLYDATRGIFESYITNLITYALIPVITSAILMIVLSVDENVYQFMNNHSTVTLSAIWPFILMCLIQVYLLAQVFAKASALGSGFALGGAVQTMKNAGNSMKAIAKVATGGPLVKKALGQMNMNRSSGRSGYRR